MKKVLLIDNYDSFTYNLVQYLGELGAMIEVYRNDERNLKIVKRTRATHIIISPGPKTPSESGISNDVIKIHSGKIPILGVCLGHQCIVSIYGGEVGRAKNVMHGKTDFIFHYGKDIFKGVKNPFSAMRYHSLIAVQDKIPETLEVMAYTKKKEVMAVKHKEIPHLYGVQFHPESYATECGKIILSNFLKA